MLLLMRVLFCYAHLHREVAAALERHAPGALYCYAGADCRAQWRAVRDNWGRGEDLCLLEQHAVLGGYELPGFLSCPRPWCTQLSEVAQPGNWCREALTCTRFRSGFMSSLHPCEIESGWGPCACPDGRAGPGCFRVMSAALILAARGRGVTVHCHGPAVTHLKARNHLSCKEVTGELV